MSALPFTTLDPIQLIHRLSAVDPDNIAGADDFSSVLEMDESWERGRSQERIDSLNAVFLDPEHGFVAHADSNQIFGELVGHMVMTAGALLFSFLRKAIKAPKRS
jgi:hypothetical protein